MKKLIFGCLIVTFGMVNAQFNESNLYDGCDYVQDELGIIKVMLKKTYIDKFSSQEDAQSHCQRISHTRALTRPDAKIIHCTAIKDDTGYISTTMSGEFMDQYNSHEEAQEQCWKLYGYADTVESQNRDMIVVESIHSPDSLTGEGVTSQTLVHKDDIQQYYIDKQEEEIKRQNKTLK